MKEIENINFMFNYLSIDLESWASPNLPEFLRLSSQEKKILDNGHIKMSAIQILTILKKYNTKITFFIVGQLYEWYPEVIEMIAAHGHEIGYHTHTHDILTNNSVLIESMKKSEKFLQRYKPIGFRAPKTLLKKIHFQVLKEYGFKYDSSMYGRKYEGKNIDGILEIPVTSIGKVPVGSGYFIGMFGRQIVLLYRAINRNGNSVVSFIHNWQVFRPKKYTFPTKKYLLTHPHYLPYTADCSSTFEYLVKNFRFTQMKNLLK